MAERCTWCGSSGRQQEEIEELRARVAELERHLSAICEMQQRNYGHGFNTHIELSDLAADARQALAGKQEGE